MPDKAVNSLHFDHSKLLYYNQVRRRNSCAETLLQKEGCCSYRGFRTSLNLRFLLGNMNRHPVDIMGCFHNRLREHRMGMNHVA